MKVKAIIQELRFAGDAYINATLDGFPIRVKVCKSSLLPILRSLKHADMPAKRDPTGRLIIG